VVEVVEKNLQELVVLVVLVVEEQEVQVVDPQDVLTQVVEAAEVVLQELAVPVAQES
jgi:hypothetical protein